MNYIFFIPSSVDRRVGCFHVLVTVNSAAMNIGCMHPFELYFCLSVCPGVGILDDMTAVLLVF